jgi:hypothetical protein
MPGRPSSTTRIIRGTPPTSRASPTSKAALSLPASVRSTWGSIRNRRWSGSLRRFARIPTRLAVVHRTVRPDADLDEFASFVARHLGSRVPSEERLEKLYRTYAVDRYSLHDGGHLAGVHPLELWLVAHVVRERGASFDQIVAASVNERQEVCQWLHRRSKAAQDTRIRTLLEIDAFKPIHAHWASLGFPFNALVPSYASALAVSGDNPAALAELCSELSLHKRAAGADRDQHGP